MNHYSARPSPIALILFTCCILLPLHCQSAENAAWVHEIRLGVLDHDADYLWSGFSRESGIDINTEVIFTPSFALWHGHIRPNLGLSINTQGDTSKVYAGGVWQYLWRNGVILDFGTGLAVHDGEIEDPQATDKKELGSRLLLHFSLELGYSFSDIHRLFLMFDHISNGYTNDPNEGLDTLGIRYGYLF